MEPVIDRNASDLTGLPSLLALLQARAATSPETLALAFLRDGELESARLSYADLDRNARSIAAALQAHGAAGERAILLFPPGLEFPAAFFGCLYARTVAVPAYVPSNALSFERLRTIIDDARPRIILTTEAIKAKVQKLAAEADLGRVAIDSLIYVTTDGDRTDRSAEWQPQTVGRDDLAFLQYTSGSTAAPKGVMITHGNLLYNAEYIRHAFELGPDSVSVSWLPAFHDMGLIDGILQPIYTGFPGYLMAPVSFLQKPVRWLEAIARYRATHCGGPNFAYELLCRKIAPEAAARLDLSSWQTAYNGAEPVRADTLDRFSRHFAPSGFEARFHYPCYGLAEATLMVSGGGADRAPVIAGFDAAALENHRALPRDAEDARRLVSSGSIHLDTQVVIADPETRLPLGEGLVGEIWVGGPTVSPGYWGREETTRETMQARLATGDPGLYLRTGDLGFFQAGELFVTGRLKDVVIIRGRNHYPQDIERTAEAAHPAVRAGCTAAFAVDLDGEERLVVVAEIERRVRSTRVSPGNLEAMESRLDTFDQLEEPVVAQEVIKSIREAVATRHELQVARVVVVMATSIPKTSSGKIQRRACAAALREGRLIEVAPAGPVPSH